MTCTLSPSFSWLKWRLSLDACFVVISLGYFIGLKKRCLIPTATRPFLGYSCDSGRQAFLHPQDKKGKFAELREAILSKKSISVKTLQTFAGKTTSFALLVPQLSCTPILCIRPFPELLRVPLSKLNYLLPFERKFSTGVSLIAGEDSLEKWVSFTGSIVFGCLLILNAADAFLDPVDSKMQFVVVAMKPIEVVPSSSKRFRPYVSHSENTRLDVFVDNKPLVSSWESQVSKSAEVSYVMKSIFQFSLSRNLSLSLSLSLSL